MTYYGEHAKVWLSVDVIIFGFDEGKLKVLIGRRQMDPGRGEWSLYGGFVAEDEGIDECAGRTLKELTGIRWNGLTSTSFPHSTPTTTRW